MIVTLGIMAERVIRRLSGGDIPSDSPYKMAFVMEDCRDAINENLAFKMLEKRSGQEDDKGPITQGIATYLDIEVKKDLPTDRVYAELPSNFLALKHNAGIHSVSEMKKSLKPMIPIQNPEVTIHLPHADLEGESYGFYVEGMKVFWMRDIKRDGINKVMIKLIIGAPSNLGADDMVPVLPESISGIIDIVCQRVLNKYPQDRLNDNNPNLRNLNEQQR